MIVIFLQPWSKLDLMRATVLPGKCDEVREGTGVEGECKE